MAEFSAWMDPGGESTVCPPLGWVQDIPGSPWSHPKPGCCWGSAALLSPQGEAVSRQMYRPGWPALSSGAPWDHLSAAALTQGPFRDEVTWRGLCCNPRNCLVPGHWLGAAAHRLLTSSFLEVRSPELRDGCSLQGRKQQKRLIFCKASKRSNKIHHLVKWLPLKQYPLNLMRVVLL